MENNSSRDLSSILLDFDGTLVNYYKNEALALGKVLSNYGVEKELQEYEESDYISIPSTFVQKTFFIART